MMHKILQGLDKKQNCLLESPTGSGKTLALLCACLAWQKNEKEKQKLCQELAESEAHQSPYFDTEKKAPIPEDVAKKSIDVKPVDLKMETPTVAPVLNKVDQQQHQANESADAEEKSGEDDVDFQTTKKRFRTPSGAIPSAKKQRRSGESPSELQSTESVLEEKSAHPSWKIELKTDTTGVTDHEKMLAEEKAKKLLSDYGDDTGKMKDVPRVPRIYFGTRTHKQITQIVRELKKTAFKTSRMTILSSREHSCIHPVVSKGGDKNEECRRYVKGIDGKSCKYHGNAGMLCKASIMTKYKLDQVWDIEDLVKAGKKAKACPYYAAREIMEDADIIFCPYNYLVDPHIRSQMHIRLKDEVVVLDEAHNIEDSAREAASVVITSTQLEETMDELNRMIISNIMAGSHRMMHTLCSIILQWLEGMSDTLTRTGFETAVKVFKGEEMVARLEGIEITPASLPVYKNEYVNITTAEMDPNHFTDIDAPKLSTKATSVLIQLIDSLGRVLDETQKFVADFKIAVIRKAGKQKRISNMGGGWKSAKNRAPAKSWEFSLNFWCLNPAVVFSEMTSARSIVLTSGTLSPMSSFSSELGASFPIQLEANHVIPDAQTWVGALTVGPDNKNIIANYQSSETFAFQDGVGKVILRVCETVPHGILCFFASYSMMEKLKKRWMLTGLWQNISKSKAILAEPRGSDRSALDDTMQEFYEAAQSTASDNDPYSTNGALLLAVCRGKVSEGLDFSDNNARAVITIGIPFPDFKDTQVDLKRKYNNKHCAARGLLNGSEWYEIQAYRALNQALGRCIRHKRDWGAILLVDERFGRSAKYKNGLSKWVRGRCKTYNNFQECVSSIADFAEARTLNPCPEPAQNGNNTTMQTPAIPDTTAPAISCHVTCTGGKPSSTVVRPDTTPIIKREFPCKTRDLNPEFKMEEANCACGEDVDIADRSCKPPEDIANNRVPQKNATSHNDAATVDKKILFDHRSIKCESSSAVDGPTRDSRSVSNVGVNEYPPIKVEGSIDLSSDAHNSDNLINTTRKDCESTHVKEEPLVNSATSASMMANNFSTPRYSNIDKLLQPVLQTSQMKPLAGVGNAMSSRVKLFKTASLCSTDGKQDKSNPRETKKGNKDRKGNNLAFANSTSICSTDTTRSHGDASRGDGNRGNKVRFPKGASCSLVDLGNDDFMECLTDREFSQINLDSASGNTPFYDKTISKKFKTSNLAPANILSEDSPCLFSDDSEEYLVDHQSGTGNEETGNKYDDFNKGSCKDVDEKMEDDEVIEWKFGADCRMETGNKFYDMVEESCKDLDEKTEAEINDVGGSEPWTGCRERRSAKKKNDKNFLYEFTKNHSPPNKKGTGNIISNEGTGNHLLTNKKDAGSCFSREEGTGSNLLTNKQDVGSNSCKEEGPGNLLSTNKDEKRKAQEKRSRKGSRNRFEQNREIGKEHETDAKSEDSDMEHLPQNDISVQMNTPRLYRKRVGPQRHSNLRMAADKKPELVSMEDGARELDEKEVSKEPELSVCCLYCKAVFANSNVKHRKLESPTLVKLAGSSSKSTPVLTASLSNLRNFRMGTEEIGCNCAVNGLGMNAIFSEEESTVFSPLFCESCHKKRKPRTSLIGFRILKILSADPSKMQVDSECEDFDVCLLPDKVKRERKKS